MRTIFVSAVLLAGAAGAHAQIAGSGCAADQTVGSLGISMIECDCVIAPAASDTPWRFRTEPRVLRVERDSPAAERVEVGDVITHVNGQPVTSEAGAQALERVRPHQAVTLRIRRGDQRLESSILSTAACPDDPLLLGATPAVPPALPADRARAEAEAIHALAGRGVTPVAPAGVAVAPTGQQAVTVAPAEAGSVAVTTQSVTAAKVSGAVSVAPTRAGPASTAVTPRGPTRVSVAPRDMRFEGTLGSPLPSAWIGIAFSCTDCHHTGGGRRSGELTGRWSFATPPVVYSVEPGSPAYRAGIRRGDVLTHVDDQAITTETGGRRWARIRPGERVRLRYRRGSTTRSATVQAVAPPGIAAVTIRPGQAPVQLRQLGATMKYADSASLQALQSIARSQQELARQEEVLSRLQATQQQKLQELQELQKLESAPSQRRAEELLRAIARDQRLMQQQQERQVQELVRAQRVLAELHASSDSISRAVTALSGIYAHSSAAEPRVRYSGSFNGADVEVRSVVPVTVTETATEVVIRAGDTVVTLKRTRQ